MARNERIVRFSPVLPPHAEKKKKTSENSILRRDSAGVEVLNFAKVRFITARVPHILAGTSHTHVRIRLNLLVFAHIVYQKIKKLKNLKNLTQGYTSVPQYKVS